MGNRGRCASSAHSFSASNRTFLSQSCQFVCAKHNIKVRFTANFLLFVKNETSKFSERKRQFSPSLAGLPKSDKEFLRFAIEIFLENLLY